MTMAKAVKFSPENLLEDWGSVEDWSNGDSVAPIGWTMTGTAGSVAKESTIIKQGLYSMKIISGASSTYAAEYSLTNYDEYRGRTITFGMWVYCAIASKARIYIDDGVTPVYSSYHTGSGSWEWLEVEIQVSSSNTELTFGAQVASSTITAYFDQGVAIIGETIFTELQATTINMYVKERDISVGTNIVFSSFELARKEGKYIPETKPGEKTVRIRVQLFGDSFSEVRTNYDTLMTQLLDGNKKDLYIADDRVLKVFLSGIPKIMYDADFRVYYTDLNFIAPKPYEQYCGRLRKKQSVTTSPVSFNLLCSGSFKTRPKFTFTASGGTITANQITIENLTTQQLMSFIGTVSNGASLIIDAEELTVENDSVDAVGSFVGDFIFLTPGTNYLKFTGATQTVTIDYFNRWI